MNQLAILAMGGQTVTLTNITPGYELEIMNSEGTVVATLNAMNQMYRLSGFVVYIIAPRATTAPAPIVGLAIAGGTYTATTAVMAPVATVTIM